MEEIKIRLYERRKAEDHRGEGCTGVWLAVQCVGMDRVQNG